MMTDNETIIKILEQHEERLQWKNGGNLPDRLNHCLTQYRQITDNAIYQAKNFTDDVKTQFKALEMITEGLTSGEMNHGQKRVIANHIIRMLRQMVDRLDQLTFDYNTNILERYNFFRYQTPERRIYEEYSGLKQSHDRHVNFVKEIFEKHPEIKDEFENNSIPF